MANTYPKNRKPKLSTPEDEYWYPKSYMKKAPNGKRRRYISGLCEECGEMNETTWANFSRQCRNPYKFYHLKCAQAVWNRKQGERAKAIPHIEIADKIRTKYIKGSERRGYKFDINLENFFRLIQLPCHYCGAPPQSKYRQTRAALSPSEFRYNGLDRMLNSEGYVIWNLVPCCRTCNFLKRDTDYFVWAEFLRRVKNHET